MYFIGTLKSKYNFAKIKDQVVTNTAVRKLSSFMHVNYLKN